jgi:hypothetical protein
MTYLLAIAGGALFGMADQYLGSRSALGAWAATVSLVSAPWLLLSFAAGVTQTERRRAVALGVIVIIPALVGYFAMTCSPIENVALGRSSTCITTIVRTGYNPLWILGGLLLGPVYGLLGQRWRVGKSWISAAVVTCTLCLEPLARLIATPWMLSQPVVWWSEVAIGILLAGFFAFEIGNSRGSRTPFV